MRPMLRQICRSRRSSKPLFSAQAEWRKTRIWHTRMIAVTCVSNCSRHTDRFKLLRPKSNEKMFGHGSVICHCRADVSDLIAVITRILLLRMNGLAYTFETLTQEERKGWLNELKWRIATREELEFVNQTCSHSVAPTGQELLLVGAASIPYQWIWCVVIIDKQSYLFLYSAKLLSYLPCSLSDTSVFTFCLWQANQFGPLENDFQKSFLMHQGKFQLGGRFLWNGVVL